MGEQREGTRSRSGVGGSEETRSATDRALDKLEKKAEAAFDKATSPTGIGALLGGFIGAMTPVGPVGGAKLGAEIGGLFDDEDDSEGGRAQGAQSLGPTTQSTQQPDSQPSRTTGSAQQQFSGLPDRLGGAQETRALGPAQVVAPQAQQVNPQVQLASGVQPLGSDRQNFLNRVGGLQQVDLSAFPGALGRV